MVFSFPCLFIVLRRRCVIAARGNKSREKAGGDLKKKIVDRTFIYIGRTRVSLVAWSSSFFFFLAVDDEKTMLRRQISRASAVESPLKIVFLLVKYNLGKFHFAAYQNKLPRLRVQHVIFIIITPSLPTRVCVCCLQYSSLSLRVYVECFFFGYSTFLFRSNVRVRWTAGTVYTVYNMYVCI